MNARPIRCVYVAATYVALAGCAKIDGGANWAPAFLKSAPPSSSSVAADEKPDLHVLLREQAAAAFSGIQSIKAGEPKPNGRHWNFCAKVSSVGVTGHPVTETYIIDVASGLIRDRRRDIDNFCADSIYRPIALGS